MKKNKIIIGISGGVDSSVAAMLLKEEGYEVEALFMKNWNDQTEDGKCLWEDDVKDAMQVCDKLDIPLNTVDLSKDYWEKVFKNLMENRILVRNLGSHPMLKNCLRVTIGTKAENDQFLDQLKKAI